MMPGDAPRDTPLHVSAASASGMLAPLFTPFRLRGAALKNRFVMAPMTRSFSPAGIPGQDVAAYYRRRAEGGTGLIITEGVAVPHPSAIGHSGVDVLDIPEMSGAALDGWADVVRGVHAAGGLIAPQLWHQGVMRLDGTGQWPLAPSMRPSGLWGPRGQATLVPADFVEQIIGETRPMSEEEMADVVAAFARAAADAKHIGFDAIAIHGAHGYLIDTFLWHETNRRIDRWGISGAGRSRFGAEIVRAIRRAIGPDMPILFRFSQWKLQDANARIAETPDELAALLRPIAEAGVDLFDVSERNFDSPAFDGSTLSLAGWARKLTGCATMTVGSIGLANWLFGEGRGQVLFRDNLPRLLDRFAAEEFDLAGIGRMLIAHADWVERIRAGAPFGSYRRSMLKALV